MAPNFQLGKNVYLYIAFGNIYYGGELDMREIKLPREALRTITSPIWTKTIHYQHQLMRSMNMCHALTIHSEYCWIGTPNSAQSQFSSSVIELEWVLPLLISQVIYMSEWSVRADSNGGYKVGKKANLTSEGKWN